MVSRETIARLWDNGIGADIELLEENLLEVKEGYEMGVSLMEEQTYREYVEILRNFRGSKVLEMENVRVAVKRCQNSPEELLRGSEGDVEVLALLNVLGVDIKCIYRFGKFMGANAGERVITGAVRGVFPERIKEWETQAYCEIQGVLYAVGEKEDIVRKTVRKIRNRELEGLGVVCHRIVGKRHESHLEELKFLHGKGMYIPHMVTTTGVNKGNLQEKMDKIQDFFDGMADKGLPFEAEGFKAGLNNMENLTEVVVTKGRHWENSVVSSVIELVEFKDDGIFKVPEARIKPVEVARGKVIEAVGLKSIGVMEKYGYIKGSEVYFRYSVRSGVNVCDKNGRMIS